MPQPNELNYTDTFTVLNSDGELAVAATVNAAIGSVTLNWKTSATGAITSTALTALTAGTDVHADNYAYMLGPGVLRVDFPDSPWASGASKVWAWLTFSGGLAGYEQAGGQRVFQLGYGLQNPDSGATELAREATLDEVLTDTGTTIPATLTTIGSNASTAATQSTTAATQATTAATQSTTAASGITTILSKLLKYFQLALRKDSTITTTNATEVTEIGGTFSNQTDSQEAIRDNQSAGGGATAEDVWTYPTRVITGGGGSLTEQNITDIAEAVAAEVSAQTITAEDVMDDLAWTYDDKRNGRLADRPITAKVGDELTLQFDLDGKLGRDDTVAVVDSIAITDTGATLGTPSIHSSKRKVNVRLTDIDTPGTYTLVLQFTTTTDQTRTVEGTLVVQEVTE